MPARLVELSSCIVAAVYDRRCQGVALERSTGLYHPHVPLMPRVRIAILFHRIGPYHLARLQAASRLLPIVAIESSGVDATYAWDQVDSSDDFERVTLFGDADAQTLPKADVVRHTALTLDKLAPTMMVVPGWADAAALGALHWCVKNRIPAIIMSESTAWDEPRVVWKEWIKRRIVGLVSAALVGGHPHADYIHQLRLSKDRIFIGYDVVDNTYFAAEAARWQKLKAETLKAEIRKGESEDAAIRGQGSGVSVTGQTDSSSKIQHSTFKIHPPPYFLASNRFIEKKNLFRFLDAYAAYVKSCLESVISDQLSVISDCESEPGHSAQAQRTTDNGRRTTLPWPLVLLGDGELKPQLLAHCENLGLHVIEAAPWEVEEKVESKKLKAEIEERESPPSSDLCPPSSDPCSPSSGTVFFPGFRQYDELPRFYAHGGAFVHASTTEQWGLVVNEAMACGLPVIVSNRVGCAQDLVQDGVNGFTFDPYDVAELARLMLRVSEPNFPLAAFGDASRALIADWGPERFAAGLKQAVDCALKVGPKRASLLQRMILKALLWR